MQKIVNEITSRLDVVEIANIVRDSVKDNFETGKNYDGSSMKSLQGKTIQLKSKQGGIAPSKPLIYKGGSQRGIQTQRISKKEALIVSTGNAKNYFTGKTISASEMLKHQADKGREPFGVSDKAMTNVEKYIKRKLVG